MFPPPVNRKFTRLAYNNIKEEKEIDDKNKWQYGIVKASCMNSLCGVEFAINSCESVARRSPIEIDEHRR